MESMGSEGPPCREWEKDRRRALSRLREHLEKGLVDEDIAGFLAELNEAAEAFYTTSSCSGRVAVLEGEDLFSKKGARILVAWHDPGKCRTGITGYCDYKPSGVSIAWVSLQPPILHVAARDEETARAIVRCAESAGFIRACYKARKPCGYHVEVAGHDKLHVILPAPCSLLRQACNVLERYKERLRRLEECLLRLARGG